MMINEQKLVIEPESQSLFNPIKDGGGQQSMKNESRSVLSSQSNILRYDNPKANEVLNNNQRLQEYFSLKNASNNHASKEFDLLNDLTD